MTTLAADKARKFENVDQEQINSLPVQAADTIFCGSLVGDNASGYARPLEAGDEFWGIGIDQAENEAGAAGAVFVKLKTVFWLVVEVTGVTAVTDVNSDVYASDDDTFTLASTGNTRIGKVHRWISGTKCVVKCESSPARSI